MKIVIRLDEITKEKLWENPKILGQIFDLIFVKCFQIEIYTVLPSYQEQCSQFVQSGIEFEASSFLFLSNETYIFQIKCQIL